MLPDCSLDLAGAANLADHLVQSGTDSILVNGSTGESPVTSDAEKLAILRAVIKSSNGSFPVIAGVGSSSTQQTISLAQQSEQAGASALLVVAPSYNIPTQDQLIAHFTDIADATELPVIIYDIPRRTGVRVLPQTIARLAEHPRIIGLKEACDDLDGVLWMARSVPITIWTGEDALLLPYLAAGCYGVVAFASHVVGWAIRDVLDAFAAGDLAKAFEAQAIVSEVAKELFEAPNPIRVKAVLNALGLPAGPVRPPLRPAADSEVAALVERLRVGAQGPRSAPVANANDSRTPSMTRRQAL
jgi:4-hydroxy-tetrahydrodipicolinate synthase